MKLPLPDQQIDEHLAGLRQRISDICDSAIQKPKKVQEKAQGSERRRSQRRTYPSIQKLAPCDRTRPPGQHAFHDVRLHDISRGVVSFFWPAPPDFEYIVLSLTNGRDFVNLKARVVHYQPIAGLPNEYLVCCEFLSRVKIF
jgi:hypothetical protein